MGSNQLEKVLARAGNKLLNFATLSSTEEIITILQLTENSLSTVPQSPPKSLIRPLQKINNALIAKELMRHSDMNVNISVASCICEMLRITSPKAPYNNEQIKDFFELVITSFEKLSSVPGGYYGKMIKVLKVFSQTRLPILMLDLKQDGHGLIVRLFKHFLNVSDFKSTAIVLDMEKIMRMIVEESEKLAIELQDLLLTSIGKDNQSGSPVCWQFGEKVLMICAAKLKPIDQRSITVFDYPKMVALICKTTSDKLCIYQGGKETIPSTTEASKVIDKMKLEFPASINMMQTLRHCKDTSMALRSVTEINGKRKRNNEQAQSDEHGEILVGRKIKVWQSKDEIYQPGVVKSFDVKYNHHKVLFDGGFEEVLDLKKKRWMFEKLSDIPDSSQKETQELLLNQNERLENENLERSKEKQVSMVSSEEALYSNVREVELVPAGPAPTEVSSSQSGIICAQGYKVKSINAPILEVILKKHGDIASTCVFTDTAIRTSLLEGVCDIVRRIETKDVTTIISSIKEIESQVYAAEAAKINVSWLRASLNTIHKRNEAVKMVTMLIELKSNTTLVKTAAGIDLKERHADLVAAQNQFAEAKRCVEVLDLVEKKVNNNLLESKAEKDLWAGHPII